MNVKKLLPLLHQNKTQMTTQEVKNKIKTETGLTVSVRQGTGSMVGYKIFSTKRTEQFDYDYSRNFIKSFPACEVKPAFANNYQIAIFHGVTI